MSWSRMRHGCTARRWLLVVVILMVSVASLVVWWLVPSPAARCEREVRYGDRKRGIELCRAIFDRTGDERALLWAAKGYMYLGDVANIANAEQLARRLLSGPLYGEAHGILSYVALRRRLTVEARVHAMAALAAHTAAGDEPGRASDMYLLSLTELEEGDFKAALAAADEALRLARRLQDVHTEISVSFARADALRRLGDIRDAIDMLTTAVGRATLPCDRAWAHIKRALCQLEAGQDDLAPIDFASAARANTRCGNTYLSTSIMQNQAWLLRSSDPAGALAKLDELARSQGEQVDTALLRAYIAADRGDYGQAQRYLDQAERLVPPDADWPWMIERAGAELSELRGGPFSDLVAEAYYQRAISMITVLRSHARALSAHFVSSHRSPYDGLIALLARQGRWRDVLAVVLDLDASDMLRATAEEAPTYEHVPLKAVEPEASSHPTPPSSVDDVLEAWKSRDLVIIIARSPRRIGRLAGSEMKPGNERVYRLRITEGRVIGEDVGDAATVRAWAEALTADPGDTAAGRALGRVIVPRGSADGVLDVLAIGPLGGGPLAALRDDDGSLLVARRPLARILALRAATPQSQAEGPPVIIADPTGDLPEAAKEGAMIAAVLGPSSRVFGSGMPLPATRAGLFAARDAALWHIAGHVGTLGRWRALYLADGEVTPSDIVQRRLAPQVAVLASCGSAAATDEEGWGSIAAALLEAGTATVVATDRSIADTASLAMIRELYAQSDWRTDPAHALAKVQQALDARSAGSTDEVTKPRLWAAFSVLRRPPFVAGRRP